MSSDSIPEIDSVAMLLSRVSGGGRVTRWTHRVEADVVDILREKGGTLTKKDLRKYLPYKKNEVNVALRFMQNSGSLVSDRRGEVTLVE